jgi:alkylation response protein AidB-like acyl-CoA dehydrogenase
MSLQMLRDRPEMDVNPQPDPVSDGARDLLIEAANLRDVLSLSAASRDAEGSLPKDQIEMLKARDLLRVQIPKEYGGDGRPWSTVLRMVRTIAEADGAIAHLFGYHFIWANSGYLKGNPEQSANIYRLTTRQQLFWGNASNSFSRNLLGRASDDGYLLDGYHPFCSGAAVADYLIVSWLDSANGERLTAAIPQRRAGIQPHDDWDGIGQRQTCSGSTSFSSVFVHKDEVLDVERNAGSAVQALSPLLAQSVFINIFAGSIVGAIAEARKYIIEEGRPWIHSGVSRAVDDPWIKRSFGDFYARSQAVNALSDDAARVLDIIWAKGFGATMEERGEAAVAIAAANYLASQEALEITSRLFETMGARSATRKRGFDRFWRNVRTHSLHSPAEYKAQNVGAWVLDGRFPQPDVFQ